LAFTKRIWEGRDYIHLVWDEWLADPRGVLVSAQFGARLVGIAKITPVFPGQWWLHGLRVDPDYQGRKIASHLHEYMDDWCRSATG
jgi:GNAT superfamily N-acetyltransferase